MPVACTVPGNELETASGPLATPTTFTLFKPGNDNLVDDSTGLIQDSVAVPTVASLFSTQKLPTPRPSPLPLPTLAPYRPAVMQPEDSIFFTIFKDELSSDWEVSENPESIVNLSNERPVFEGKKSIAFTPEADYTTLFFAVKENAKTVFRAENVTGVSFWLTGGDDLIALDEMAVSIIGSNDYNYWNSDDSSVEFPLGETFSETRLYYLGLNRSIPPGTWAEVYLPLDSLIYDPVYNYVVGFYLKNDEGFRNTVYLDNVRLILSNEIEAVVQESGDDNSPPAANLATDMPQSDVTPLSEWDITPEPTPQNGPTETATPGSVESESSECVVSPPDGWEIYAMKADDVLFNLAFERNLTLEVVLRVNCLEESDVFSIGQNIWLPPLTVEGSEAVEPTPAEPSPTEPSP
jgi:hypothetical protein